MDGNVFYLMVIIHGADICPNSLNHPIKMAAFIICELYLDRGTVPESALLLSPQPKPGWFLIPLLRAMKSLE